MGYNFPHNFPQDIISLSVYDMYHHETIYKSLSLFWYVPHIIC